MVTEEVANMPDKPVTLHYNKQDLERIKASLFFDFDWYVAHCSDLRGLEPALHYLVLGYQQGLDPSFFFRNNAYYEQNPDVRAVGLNPLAHFLSHGAAEGRFLSRQMAEDYAVITESGQFEAAFYLETALKDAVWPVPDALWHFLVYGADNGNNPNGVFSIDNFYFENPDVLRSRNPMALYLEERKKRIIFRSRQQRQEYETIKASGLFDDIYYAKKYKVSEEEALFHYISQGYREGCNPSANFSNRDYLAINRDVDTATISPLGHYCCFGQKEGRYRDSHDKQYTFIKNSPFFDAAFYARRLPANVDPVEHYLKYGNNEGRDPSPQFSTRAYLALNPDVFLQNINALFHYETSGRVQHRAVDFSTRPDVVFPETATSCEGDGTFRTKGTHRVAIFSSYDGEGRYSASAAYYARGLQQVCDAIVVVLDNPLLPEALADLAQTCTHYICRRHRMYDFGSYKLGLAWVYENLNLDDVDEIVCCNDSMYGPILPFADVFAAMRKQDADFWGLTLYHSAYVEALQSFFLCFRRDVFLSPVFRNFFACVQQETNRAFVVARYELQLTKFLVAQGYTYASFIDKNYPCTIPTKQPLRLVKDYGFPLIKRKAIFEDCQDDKRAVLDYVRTHNADLYAIMVKDGCEQHLHDEYMEAALTASDYALVKRSPLFDVDFYRRNYWYVDIYGFDPVEHYLTTGYKSGNNPSAAFSSKEYCCCNPDVAQADMNPLLHYEKFGRRAKRPLSLADCQDTCHFPTGAVSLDQSLNPLPETARSVAIFALFSQYATVSDLVLYYLKALRKVVDYIIVAADNPLLPQEAAKLKPYVGHVICQRHGEYDFGSYKRGFAKLQEQAALARFDEIVFCNDSCVGPVNPGSGFDTLFAVMREKHLDVWSVARNQLLKRQEHYCSYFIVLGKKVFLAPQFAAFLQKVRRQLSGLYVVLKYEIALSRLLADLRCTGAAFLENLDPGRNPLFDPLDYVAQGNPLIKVKFLQKQTARASDHEAVLQYLRVTNPDLFACIDREILHPVPCKIPATGAARVPSRKKTLVVHFYVNTFSMFAGRALFEHLQQDSRFTVACVPVPDCRFGAAFEHDQYVRTRSALLEAYGPTLVQDSWDAEDEEYRDLSDLPDFVCYSSHYDSTHPFYSVRYLSRKAKTFCINYGFYRAKYDRKLYQSENYGLFWKVFLETDYNFIEAQRYMDGGAANCEVVGYAKMDTLAQCKPLKENRPLIIIAPHHSVAGGFNPYMYLSNFLKYASYFLTLPRLFPQVDFVFRPHPMLFAGLVQHGIWTNRQVKDYQTKLHSLPHMRYDDTEEYFDLFAASDACIHDCGSYLVEYFYTNKPQCYLLKNHYEEKEVFAPLGRECLRRVYKAYDTTQMASFISNVVLGGHDTLRTERENFAQTVIMKNYPHVCEKITNCLLKAEKEKRCA